MYPLRLLRAIVKKVARIPAIRMEIGIQVITRRCLVLLAILFYIKVRLFYYSLRGFRGLEGVEDLYNENTFAVVIHH